jgi:hypothetical protein
MLTMKKICVLFFLSLFFATAMAKSNLYQVNVIVFKNLTEKALKSEAWPNELKTPNVKGAIDLAANPEPIDFSSIDQPVLLPENQFGLKNELERLQSSGNYQVLTYFSWVQNFNETPRWIHIVGGQGFDQAGRPVEDVDHDSYYRELNGKIKIAVDYYINLSSDLYLTEPDDSMQPTPLRTFSMGQKRRLKLNEVNYLDHPLIGALINIERR